MAKTISIRERPVGNGNIQAVAVPLRHGGGWGSLPITTHYYKAIANGYSDFYDDLNAWLSVPSEEVEVITTSLNRVVWIHFDNDVSWQEETTIIRTNISWDYNQTDNNWVKTSHFPRIDNYRSNHYMGCRTNNTTEFNRYEITASAMALTPWEVITGANSGATALVVSNPDGWTTFKVWTVVWTFENWEELSGSVSWVVGTFTSISAKDGWVMEDYSSAGWYTFPVYDEGLPCIIATSDDPDDLITPQDIYEWLHEQWKEKYITGVSLFDDGCYKTKNWYDLCNFFRFKFSIYTNNFKIPGGVVISQALAKHMFRNWKFVMGEKTAKGRTHNWAGIIGSWHLAFYNTLARGGGSSININGSMMWMTLSNFSHCNKDPFYQITYPATLKDSILRSSWRWNPTYNIKNTRMMVKWEIGSSSNNNISENVNWNTYLWGSYSQAEATFKNIWLVAFNSYNYYLDSYYLSTGTRVINSNNVTYYEPKALYFGRLRGASTWTDTAFLDKYTLDLNIVDTKWNPIENAEVFAVDRENKKGLFSVDWKARTYQRLDRDKTNMKIHSWTVKVWSYYRSWLEIIKILSGTSPNYEIERWCFGSTPNNIGGSSSWRMSYLYEMFPSIKSDIDWKCSTNLTYRQYQEINLVWYKYIYENDLDLRWPYKIRIQKSWYLTETLTYDPNIKRNMTVQMTAVKSYNQHKTIT